MTDLFWEDLAIGDISRSPGRTITEADLVNFAGLSGDFNSIHMDEVYAAKFGIGGERVVHGLLGLSIMSGLFTRSEMGSGMQSQLVAMLSLEWTFKLPLRVGDTVTVEAEVVDVRPTSNPARGVVEIRRSLINQLHQVVQTGSTMMMVRRRLTLE